MQVLRGRYWVAYYLVYLLTAGVLLSVYSGRLWEADAVHLWASIITVSAGAALAAAFAVEIVGRAVLLIPAAIKDIQKSRDDEWETWLKKYKDAVAKGQPFDEPSPSERRSSR